MERISLLHAKLCQASLPRYCACMPWAPQLRHQRPSGPRQGPRPIPCETAMARASPTHRSQVQLKPPLVVSPCKRALAGEIRSRSRPTPSGTDLASTAPPLQGLEFADCWPPLAKFDRTWATNCRHRANFGRKRSNLADFSPICWPNTSQRRSKSHECGRVRANFGRIRAKLGRVRIRFDGNRVNSGRAQAECGRIRAHFGRMRAKLDRVRVRFGRVRVKFGRAWPISGQIWSRQGQLLSNLVGPGRKEAKFGPRGPPRSVSHSSTLVAEQRPESRAARGS